MRERASVKQSQLALVLVIHFRCYISLHSCITFILMIPAPTHRLNRYISNIYLAAVCPSSQRALPPSQIISLTQNRKPAPQVPPEAHYLTRSTSYTLSYTSTKYLAHWVSGTGFMVESVRMAYIGIAKALLISASYFLSKFRRRTYSAIIITPR
jgi:hypothetical protein